MRFQGPKEHHYLPRKKSFQKTKSQKLRSGIRNSASCACSRGPTNLLGIRYGAGQTHAEWSEIDRRVMFDGEEVDYFWILAEAKQRYIERKLALAEQGFIYSDTDW